jgi:hypothetical protein
MYLVNINTYMCDAFHLFSLQIVCLLVNYNELFNEVGGAFVQISVTGLGN